MTGESAKTVPDWVGGGLLNHPLWSSALQPLLQHPWHTDWLLDFCELVMGPCVQLDSFGISAFPIAAAAPAAAGGRLRPPAFAWHRDNFAQSQYYAGGGVDNGGFWGGFRPCECCPIPCILSYSPYRNVRGLLVPCAAASRLMSHDALHDFAATDYRIPSGMNLLCYLQDMNAQTGPLRVIPASHLGAPPTPVGEATWLPHPQEQLLDLKAGDLVVIHSDLIHSGTPPTDSTRIRMYGLTATDQRLWLCDSTRHPFN